MFSIQDKWCAVKSSPLSGLFSWFPSVKGSHLPSHTSESLPSIPCCYFFPLFILISFITMHWSKNFPPIAVWGSTELSSSNPDAQHHAGLEKKTLSAVTMGKIWPHPNHSGLQCDVSDCCLNVSYPVTPNSFEGMEDAWQFSLCSQFSIWQLSSLFWMCINSHFWRVETVKHVEENTSNIWTNFCLGTILQRMQQRHLVKRYEKLFLLGERNI